MVLAHRVYFENGASFGGIVGELAVVDQIDIINCYHIHVTIEQVHGRTGMRLTIKHFVEVKI